MFVRGRGFCGKRLTRLRLKNRPECRVDSTAPDSPPAGWSVNARLNCQLDSPTRRVESVRMDHLRSAFGSNVLHKVLPLLFVAACGGEVSQTTGGAGGTGGSGGGGNAGSSGSTTSSSTGGSTASTSSSSTSTSSTGTGGTESECEKVGGMCIALVPDNCMDGMWLDANMYPCGTGEGVGCCLVPVCTPGMDQTCNASPTMSALAGHCEDNGTCTCNPGYEKTPEGKCL